MERQLREERAQRQEREEEEEEDRDHGGGKLVEASKGHASDAQLGHNIVHDSTARVNDHEGSKGPTSQRDEAEDEASLPLATYHANGLEDQTNYMPLRKIIVCFLSMQLTVLLYFLEQTVLATALPALSAAFDAGRSSSFVAAAFLLTSSAMQPVWGRLSDVFGRKITLLVCLVIFLVGSLACALAKTILPLPPQIFRGLQGFGGGGLLTLVFIIVSDIISLKDRGLYQGITEVTIMVGNGVGPVLGGVLTENLGWRWCFWINLPVGGAAFLALLLFLPLKPVKGSMKEKLKKVDYGGSLLTMGSTALIVLPLNWGGTSFPWASGPVVGCLVSGAVLLGLFVMYEWKIPKIPVVPPSIFRHRTVSSVAVTTFISGATVLVQNYYLPQYFQVVRGESPIRSGLLILPQLLTVTFSVGVSGIVVSRTGKYKALVLCGFAIWTVGLGLLSTLDAHSSTARIIGFELLNGAGQGQTLQTTVVAAQAAVARSEMSVVTSARNYVRALGGTVFLVIAAMILNNTLRGSLTSKGLTHPVISSIIDDPTVIWRTSSAPELLSSKNDIISGYVGGFHKVFWMHAALMGFCFCLSAVALQEHSLMRAEDEALKRRGEEWMKERKSGTRREGDVEKGPIKNAPEAAKAHDVAGAAATEPIPGLTQEEDER
ncbi:hypothetical protein JCM11251_007619 [Rhodosporidiobolus azoricus]